MENRDVFISYHTNSAKEKVERICQALEKVGVSCWYAPRDVAGPYAGAIENAIEKCQVFLLMLNEASSKSQHVLNEVDTAFDRFHREEKIELLPFQLEKCQPGPDMRYYIRRIHIMDGSNPPEEMRTRELVDRICKILGKNPEKMLLVASESGEQSEKQYKLIGQMMYPDTHFVGRREELEQIHDQLSGVVNKVLLVGMGGIGKSEIAKMYLKENREAYDVVLWVSFEGSLRQTIASDSRFPIQGLSHGDYPEDDEQAYFERKLQILKQLADNRVLIVMDNFDVTGDPDLEAFCGGSYSVIFTTRYHQSGSELPEVEVRGMTEPAQQMEVFRAEYQRPLAEKDLNTVYNILSLLEGHPLSIRLVASAMQKNRRLRPEDMLEMLKSGTAHGEKQSIKGTGTIGAYLQQVFRVSSLTEEEQFVLKNLSLIPLIGVEVMTFADWCGLEDFDVLDGLIDKSWIVHDPVEDTIHLHPLVADLMQEKLREDPACCNQLIENIYKACIVEKDNTWEQKLWLNELASALFNRLPAEHEKRYMALESKARLCMSMAWYEKAANYFCQMISYAQTREHRWEMHYKHAHAWVLGGFGEEGILAAQAGIAEVECIPIEELSRIEGNWLMALYNRMTEAYVLLEQYDQAVVYARMAVQKGGKRFYSKTPESSQGWREFHLARSLLYAGQYEEAEQVICDAIANFDAVNDLWSVNYAYDILGQVLAKTGRCEEALQYNSRAAQILQPLYGNEHADSAANLEYKGNIYAAMGQTEKARGCYQQAIEIFHKCQCHKRAEALMKKM